jgi:hypothetical protein
MYDPNSDKIFDTGIISSGLNPFVTIGNAIFIAIHQIRT